MEKLCLPLGDLNQGDIDWLNATGCIQEVPISTVLIEVEQTLHEIYFVLDGLLVAFVKGADGVEQQVREFKPGESIGFLSFINTRPSVVQVVAIEPSRVLAISLSKLTMQLRQNSGFAVRLYQTIAVFLSDQLRGISTLLVRSVVKAEEPLRKVLLVFSEIYDSDLDWMVKIGLPLRLSQGELLIEEGQSLDAIYILLEGTLSVSVSAMVNSKQVSKEIAKLSTGEILGEMSFIGAQSASATVKTIENCLVLSLPRSNLAAKLQQDERFATRFYRAIAVVLANRLQDRLTHHGYGNVTYDKNQPLHEEMEYEDELDVTTLEHVSLAGVRFDWLLKRVRGSF